jgi:dihydrofolate synthase/folylpolyglutamate synthase
LKTLEDWLPTSKACIRKGRQDRTGAGAHAARQGGARAGAALPGDHRRRHQRQGFDLRLPGNIIDRAGYRVGCYTSPHLLAYNERVRLNGKPASDDGAVRRLRPGRGGRRMPAMSR